MQMYIDTKRILSSTNNSSTTSLSSLSSSFASDSTWDMVDTPTSSQETPFDASSPFVVHQSYSGHGSDTLNDYLMMTMTQPSQSLSFVGNNSSLESQAPVEYSGFEPYSGPVYEEFIPPHGLPTPPLDGSSYASIMSTQASIDYVSPTETTFGSNFDLSPVRSTSALNLQQYDSPVSDYHTDYSFNASSDDSMDDSFNSSMSTCSSVNPTPVRPSQTCHVKTEVLESSAALQQIQKGTAPGKSKPTRRHVKCQQRRMKAKFSEEDFQQHFPDLKFKRSASRTIPCTFSECPKMFAREEHKKRHEKSVHAPTEFLCAYCLTEKPKKFQKERMDNYKTHLGLHLKPEESGRTNYNPAARTEYETLCAKARTRGLTKAAKVDMVRREMKKLALPRTGRL